MIVRIFIIFIISVVSHDLFLILIGPMCRKQLEPEVPVGATAEAWTCPGCRNSLTDFTCSTCGIRRNVISMANTTAAPLFSMVESLFFEILEHRRVYGATAEFDAGNRRFVARIEQLARSSEMDAVVNANWVIRDAVRSLLHGAINEENHFGFRSNWMDVNSVALYSILVDRLTTRLSDVDSEKSIQRPLLSIVNRPGIQTFS